MRGLLEILDHAADRIAAGGDVLRRSVGQMIERVELRRRDGFEMQEALGQRFDARRIIELAPFGAQRGDLVALVTHLAAQLGETLGLDRGVELDAIDPGGGEHQHSDHDKIEHAQDHGRPRMMSASDGSRGNRSSMAASRGGASVRSAARSLAERARGLAAISASSGVSGRRVSTRNVGGGAATTGRWREPSRRAAALGEEGFDDAIFERVEGDHDNAA